MFYSLHNIAKGSRFAGLGPGSLDACSFAADRCEIRPSCGSHGISEKFRMFRSILIILQGACSTLGGVACFVPWIRPPG